MNDIGRHHDIVVVSAYYPPHLGGLERVAQALARRLSSRHRVRVLTTNCGSGNAPRRERESNMDVRRCPGFTIAHTAVSPALAFQLLATPRRALIHAHVAQAFIPELVWATTFLKRQRYIAHFHLDVDPSGPMGVLLAGYKRLVFGPFLRRAARVLVLSTEQADFVRSQYSVPDERIVILPNGVDEDFFASPEVATTPSAHRRRFLFVGRLDAQKNVRRLVEAMSYVSADVELVVVGDGEERQLIADRIRDLGLNNVELTGAAHGTALRRWYAWADAFVLPSDKEGMSIALLEAMAAGLAVIATDVGGTRELMSGRALLTAPDPRALGSAMQRVASDDELFFALRDSSRRAGEQFRWDGPVATLETIYDLVAL